MTRLLPLLAVVSSGCWWLEASDSGGDTDGTPPGPLLWWMDCGDPVCGGYRGPFAGVPACTTEAEGDPCAAEGLQCDPVNDCNALLVCSTEDPTAQTGGCPISTASAKTEVRYLGADDRAAVLDGVLSTRLARWRYRTDDPGATRLGFILEDGPPAEAVRPGGGRVDLYGYTSLAIGAIQAQQATLDAQQRELEALRADLDALRRQCPGPSAD